MRGFTVILMILVGAVFVAGPAGLLASLTPETLDTTFWIVVVFIYYVLATLLPVDKIIGKIYPLFAIALLFMAAAGSMGRLAEYQSQRLRIAYLSYHVCQHCVWGNQWLPRHAKPVNGALHDE